MSTAHEALRAVRLLHFVREHDVTITPSQLGFLMELVEEFVREAEAVTLASLKPTEAL